MRRPCVSLPSLVFTWCGEGRVLSPSVPPGEEAPSRRVRARKDSGRRYLRLFLISGWLQSRPRPILQRVCLRSSVLEGRWGHIQEQVKASV